MEDKECHKKLNHQQKKQSSKKDCIIKRIGKKWKQNAWKRSEKSFHHWGFRAKKYNWYGNIKRPHPGATSIDICDYIKPELRQKPDVVIVHCGTNDIPNNINTFKKIKKLVKQTEENNHENIPQLLISSIIKRYDQDYNEEIQSINDKLQRFCTSKGSSFIDNNNIHKSCLNKGKLHLNRRGSSFFANNFKKFVNALWRSEPLSKICPNVHEHPLNSLDGLTSLTIHNHSNITLSYLNIN